MSKKRKSNSFRRFDPETKNEGREFSAKLTEARKKAAAEGKVITLRDRENAHRRMMAGYRPPTDAA